MYSKSKNSSSIKYQQSFHIGLVAFFVFLLPMKFGNIIGVPETTLIWNNSILWILETYPSILFPILSVLLLISALAAGGHRIILQLNKAFILSLLWLFLAVSSLIGFFNASVMDFPIIFSLHFFGLAIFAFTILITLKLSPNAGLTLVRALILGTSLMSFMAIHQLFWGFKNSIEFIQNKELETGVQVSHDLWLRIKQTRVFAPFSLCNNLAAHLILTIPIIFVGLLFDKKTLRLVIIIIAISLFLFFFDGYGITITILSVLFVSFLLALALTSFFNENIKWISPVFSVLFTIFLLFILKHTFSRGAVMSFGLIIAFIPFFFKLPRKLKFGYAALSLIIFIVFFMIVNQNRGLLANSSLHARFDYWKCAGEIFLKNPLLGTGWGDFFHEYTIIKTFPGTEAPHTAHNFILDFASQCGIVGLLSSCAIFFATIAFLYKKKINENKIFCSRFDQLAILCGISAWFLHSLTDINFQVTGTLASVIVLSLVSTNSENCENRKIPFAKIAITIIALPLLFFSIQRLRAEICFDHLRGICEPVILDEKNPEKYSPRAVEKALENARIAMPYSPYPWASAGLYAQEHGMWKHAESFFSEALKRSPERSSFYHRLAIAQFNIGNYTAAVENLRRASELFPNNENYKQSYEQLKKSVDKKNIK